MARDPVIKFHGYGYGSASNRFLAITIDGRQALEEGPRKVGHCNRCKGRCRGVTSECDARVYEEGRRRAS